MNGKQTTTAMLGGMLVIAVLALSSTGAGYADLATEKPQIMEKASEKMQDLAQKDLDEERGVKYSAEEYGIPYNVVFEDGGKLVAGIDAHKAIEFEKRYTEDEVKADLETKADVEVRYYVFEPEANVRGGDATGSTTSTEIVRTITLVRDGKIITVDHWWPRVGDVLYAGPRENVNCRELRIDFVQTMPVRTSDAVYGTDQFQWGCDHNYVENSIRYNGNTYSVTDGTSSDIRRLLRVHVAGAVTGGSTGHVIADGALVRHNATTMTNQALANYASTSGDSGAPVFVTTGQGSAKIIGQHVGRICVVEFTLNDPVRFCPDDEQSPVKVFSPWPEVKRTLGI